MPTHLLFSFQPTWHETCEARSVPTETEFSRTKIVFDVCRILRTIFGVNKTEIEQLQNLLEKFHVWVATEQRNNSGSLYGKTMDLALASDTKVMLGYWKTFGK